MVFELYNGTSWIDMKQYFADHNFKASMSDVHGPNSGTALSGKRIQDVVAHKASFQITTRPIPNADALALEAIMNANTFRVRTDFFGAVSTELECSTDSISKNFVHRHGGADLVVISTNISEI